MVVYYFGHVFVSISQITAYGRTMVFSFHAQWLRTTTLRSKPTPRVASVSSHTVPQRALDHKENHVMSEKRTGLIARKMLFYFLVFSMPWMKNNATRKLANCCKSSGDHLDDNGYIGAHYTTTS